MRSLLIDAVVGTGFKPPLRGLAVSVREMVEATGCAGGGGGCAVGMGCEFDGAGAAGAFRADAVVTFTAPKMAHMFGHLTRNEKTGDVGPVVVAEIGSPEQAVVSKAG